MTAAITFHVSSELKRCLVVWKEFLKMLYRVLGALPNTFYNFPSFGIRKMCWRKWKSDTEYSLTIIPTPPSTAQNHIRLLSTRSSSHSFPSLLLVHVLVDDGPDPTPPFDITRKVSMTTPSCSGYFYVYQTNGRYFVLSTPLGGDAKLGGGKGFEPQGLYIRT